MKITKEILPKLLKLMYPETIEEFKFCGDRKFRADFFIPSLNVLIEYEGIVGKQSRHTNIVGYSNDCDKYNLASILGYKVLRYTALNLDNIFFDLEKIKKGIDNKV